MIIDVDAGNTRIKWRSSHEPEKISYFTWGASLPGEWQCLSTGDRVRVSSVRSAAETAALVQMIERRYGVVPEIAQVAAQYYGLAIAYSSPASFGVDRWLGLLAVRDKFPGRNCVVLSGGTAVTADLATVGGQHLGGYIAPGFHLAVKALGEKTARVGVSEFILPAPVAPGATTLECTSSGLTLLYRGFLLALHQIVETLLCDPLWIFTGGDADSFHQLWVDLQRSVRRDTEPKWQSDAVILPALVLDGLSVALP